MKKVSWGLRTEKLFRENYKSVLSLKGTVEKMEHWQWGEQKEVGGEKAPEKENKLSYDVR